MVWAIDERNHPGHGRQALGWHRISATFSARVKDIDLSEVIVKGCVFAPLRDRREVFEQVRVNPQAHTVEWPGELDLDAEVLYGRFEPASGARIERRTVRAPLQAGQL